MTQSVIQLSRTLPSGWTVGMFLVPLGDGGLLVHSPTWLGPKTFETIERHGTPRILLAPNHFHHLSMQRFRDQYPEATPLASLKARPRLSEQGHTGLSAVEEHAALPGDLRILVCEGSRAGEVVVSLPEGDRRTWIVCDSFFNVPGPFTGVKGIGIKLLQVGPDLSVGRTFRFLHLADRKAYLAWLRGALDAERPHRVLFSHGQPLEGDDVPERLWAIAERRLG